MSINLFQALILGLFASLSSMPGMGSSSIGNYTLGRPLVGGLVCGLVLGDLKTGILVGVAMQIVYIALVTPGGTVSAVLSPISVSRWRCSQSSHRDLTRLPNRVWRLLHPSARWSAQSVPFFSTVRQHSTSSGSTSDGGRSKKGTTSRSFL